jgi:WD40 repeat protein
MVAAATNDGLVILQLAAENTRVVNYLSAVIDPRNLQFSPDGRWLALRDGLTLHIIETRKSGAHIRLPVTTAADWSWSPDSARLAYTDGSGQLAVFDTARQTNQVLIPASEYAWGMPVWTQDSQQIAYAVVFPLPNSGETLQQGLWRVQPASGYRVQIADNPDAAHTLLVPAAWVNGDAALLAWDASAGPAGHLTTLYRIDTGAHGLDRLEDRSLAQGTRLIWPVNTQGITLVTRHERLAALNLGDKTRQYILNPVPWPQSLAWSPNGAWMAYTVSGAAEGEGLYLFATEEGELRAIPLPGGATEKMVAWAGAEHLFVFRQRQDNATTELWLVSITTSQAPQRIMTNVRLPDAASGSGWQWNDVRATQIVG